MTRRYTHKPPDPPLDLNSLPMKAGPNWPTTANNIVIDNRRRLVASYLLRGWTERRIAHEVGVSSATIHKDSLYIQSLWKETQIGNTERTAIRDLARLDAAIDNLWPLVELPNLLAINVLAKLIEQRSKILGYQTGLQIDVETYVRQLAESHGFDPDRAMLMAQRITVTL